MRVGLIKMNKELLDKLKKLTNSIVGVESFSLSREHEGKEQVDIAIRRGSPTKLRAEKNQKLKNQLKDFFN